MKTFLTILRIILTLPTLIFGWLYVLFFCMIGAAKTLKLNKSNLILSAIWRHWATKIWKYSTTLSRGIIYQPHHGGRIIQHEQIHVEQVEDRVLLSLIIGIIFGIALNSFWVFLAVWVSGVAWQLPNFLGSILRGRRAYRDSEHERSAYAQSDTHHTSNGKSWLDWI